MDVVQRTHGRDAQLDLCSREDRFDGFREALKTIYTSNEHVIDTCDRARQVRLTVKSDS
jgi:hypothetical protein